MKREQWIVVGLALTVAAVAVLAYLPSLGAAFVWDDELLVVKDARCRGDLAGCFSVPFFPQSPFLDVPRAYWRPLVTLSFSLLGAARTQHAFNVALHATNAALLFAFARRCGARPIRATAATLVWALHPRFVEAVTWVVGRTDLLATTFTLGALLLWPFEDEDDPNRERQARVASAVLVLLGLLAKEVALAGAVAIVAASLASHGTRRGLARSIPIGGAVAIYAVARASVLGATASPSSSASLGARLAAPFETIARYAEMTLLFHAPWTARGSTGVVSPAHVAAGVVIVALGIALVVRVLRRGPPPVVAATALAATSLLAVSQIVPVALQGALTADRLLYLPLAGIALVLVLPRSADGAAGRRGRAIEAALAAAALVVAVASVFVIRATIAAFTDDVLFLVTVAERADPANVGPRNAVASVVRDRGVEPLACELFARSRAVLERTHRTEAPAYRRATENLASCRLRTGAVDEAVALYRKLADTTDAGRVQLGLGYALLAQLDFDGADAAFARAAESGGEIARLATNLRSDVALARSDHEKIAALPPDDHAARARCAASVGRAVDAEREWSAVVADTHAPDALRLEGARYLALDASLDAAAGALATCPPCRAADPTIAKTIDARRTLARAVLDRRDRIEKL